ncbi:MAG: SAM-dependent methyltransferase [Desulfuromonadales bacterium C00003094]|jgi:uncharacterized protein YbaR (Trm112 family)|nr:MAG: SAM-dependent methyltransferase [Desulfuromonadales bacterium C00003094]OEU72765.1 MAG: SAM-dependent methyltransferase [Desulfuromonadales bacterium C00003107]
MKTFLLEFLICPACLPEERPLQSFKLEVQKQDIISGQLTCKACSRAYPIREGIAFLTAAKQFHHVAPSKYETASVLSSYLWSHYGDLLKDPDASDAYHQWAALLKPEGGLAIDIGAAVGRFSFELARKSDRVIGVDSSYAFVKAARDLLLTGKAEIDLAVEGILTRKETIILPKEWPRNNVEFIVGDALALPFRQSSFTTLTSLNLIDKVPKPLQHLAELNRIAKYDRAQLLFSDPFSWSTEVAEEQDWLGGTHEGSHAGRGMDNLKTLLQDHGNHLKPAWQIDQQGQVWWKIRTHCNHFELIRSCYIKADRNS